MKLIKESVRHLATAVFALAFFLAGAQAAESATDTLVVEGKDVVITLPEGFGKASPNVAAAIEKLVTFEDFKPEVWSYTRKAVEDEMASGVEGKKVGEYLVISYRTGAEPKNYSIDDFLRAKDVFNAGRQVVGTEAVSLEDQLAEPCPPEKPLKAIALERESATYSFWLSAVDTQPSTPDNRMILLTMEGLFYKDGLAFSMSIVRYYTSSEDLTQIRKDMGEFIKLNLE